MENGKIISMSNYGNVYRYVIQKQKNIHKLFCDLFSELKFSEDSILKVDIVFDDLDNDYIYINEKEYEIHIFITKENMNLVIKTDKPQEDLNNTLKKFFEIL